MIDNDYLDIITSEYRDKVNFMSTVENVTRPFLDIMETVGKIKEYLDIDVGRGDALDKLGQWIGLSRTLESDLEGVFFTWDTDSVGWDQGVWKEPYTPDTSITTLDDDNYRVFLKAKIIANTWDGTISGCYKAMRQVFPRGDVKIEIQDNQDLTFTIVLKGKVFSAIVKELFKKNYIPIKPIGVKVNYEIGEE